MRIILLISVCTANIGCASIMGAAHWMWPGPQIESQENKHWADTNAGKYTEKVRKGDHGQWEKWDKKYVSDEIVQVEIIENKK